MKPTELAKVVALYALFFGGLGVGACAVLPKAEHPKSPEDAERQAYQVALEANDSASITIDLGKAVLQTAVKTDIAKRALKCTGTGDERAECEAKAARAALAAGSKVGLALDEATELQTELRRALIYYTDCAPGPEDARCRASRIESVRQKMGTVKAAAEAARKKAQEYVQQAL